MNKISPSDLQEITERAEFAFWQSVASEFPSIGTGDLDPLESCIFSRHCERAVRAWADENGVTYV